MRYLSTSREICRKSHGLGCFSNIGGIGSAVVPEGGMYGKKAHGTKKSEINKTRSKPFHEKNREKSFERSEIFLVEKSDLLRCCARLEKEN